MLWSVALAGFGITVLTLLSAVIPPPDVESALVFEVKLWGGLLGFAAAFLERLERAPIELPIGAGHGGEPGTRCELRLEPLGSPAVGSERERRAHRGLSAGLDRAQQRLRRGRVLRARRHFFELAQHRVEAGIFGAGAFGDQRLVPHFGARPGLGALVAARAEQQNDEDCG